MNVLVGGLFITGVGGDVSTFASIGFLRIGSYRITAFEGFTIGTVGATKLYE